MEKYLKKENYITRNSSPDDWRDHINGFLIKIYQKEIKGSVLDFGCNHGACSFLLCENPLVEKVYGLDINEKAVEVANNTKNVEKFKNYNINFFCNNILDFAPSEMFDTIVSFHTIEHIFPEDIDKALSILYNALKPDCYFITSIPYEHAFDDGTQHVAFYNEKTLSELFERNKFKTIECFLDMRGSESNILTGVFKKI